MTRLNEINSLANVNATSTTSTTVRVVGRAFEHDREPEHGADHVRAGVAEHQAFVQVVAEEARERADDGRDRDADAVGARDERERNPREQSDFDRATRRAVEEIREVRRERDEERVGDDPRARRRCRRADSPRSRARPRARPPPTIFTRPVVTRPCASAPRWPRNPWSACVPDEVVEQAEQPETDAREQHEQPGGVAAASFPTPNAPNSERPPSISDDREDREQARRGRDRPPAVVRPLERGRAQQVVARADEQPRRRARRRRTRAATLTRPREAAGCASVAPSP